MTTNLDVRFEEALARDTSLPAIFVDPTRSLENSAAVQNRLASLRAPSRFAAAPEREASVTPVAQQVGVAIPGVRTPSLPKLGPAPDFTHTQRWFNTPGGRALTLSGLRGHVVLVDFWTYTCINCIRTLPFLKGLYATYHRYGLEIVGVETPEFTFEQEAGNVQQAIASDGLRYPVVQDNAYGTWNAYQNQYWPAEYLIDAQGQVRHTQFGEGSYRADEAAVRQLLYEAGARKLPPPMTAHAIMPSSGLGTPETYLDAQRNQGFAQPLRSGTHFYPGVASPSLNEFGLHGTWTVTNQSATPRSLGATITGRFQAAHAYLVLTSAGDRPRSVRVSLDGHPIARRAGRGRRPRRRRHRAWSASLCPGLAARRPAAHSDPPDPAGGQRLRLHVRVATKPAADRSHASARCRSSGVLTLKSSPASNSSSIGAEGSDHGAHGGPALAGGGLQERRARSLIAPQQRLSLAAHSGDDGRRVAGVARRPAWSGSRASRTGGQRGRRARHARRRGSARARFRPADARAQPAPTRPAFHPARAGRYRLWRPRRRR